MSIVELLSFLKPTETTLPDTNTLGWATKARSKLFQDSGAECHVCLDGDTWTVEVDNDSPFYCGEVMNVPVRRARTLLQTV